MKISSVHTVAIRANDMTLLELVDAYVPVAREGMIVAISSKVVALCEGRVVKAGTVDVQQLARDEAQYYLTPSDRTLGYSLTVNRNILVSKAGIDESNTDGHYVLWPNPYAAPYAKLNPRP